VCCIISAPVLNCQGLFVSKAAESVKEVINLKEYIALRGCINHLAMIMYA